MATPSSSSSHSDCRRAVGIFVKNLPSGVRSKDLEALFSQSGNVLDAEVTLNRQKRSCGWGTVRFNTVADAEQAIQQYNGFLWRSRILEVAREEEESDDQDSANEVDRDTDDRLTRARTDSEEDSTTPTTHGASGRQHGKKPFPHPPSLSLPASKESTQLHHHEHSVQAGLQQDTNHRGLLANLAAGPSSHSNMFPDASEVLLEGNNLYNAGRNIYHFHPSITLSLDSERRAMVQCAPDAPPTTMPISPIMAPETVPSNMNSTTTSPSSHPIMGEAEHESEAYARLLLPRKYGWPMWLPKPLRNLPEAYRKRGTSIGDVGVITAAGDFDFFFNICLPADDPINRNSVPENFVPISHPDNAEDVRVEPEAWLPGDYVVTKSIRDHGSVRVIGDANHPQHYQFLASAPAGALLLMPKGASREDLLNIEPFGDYAKKHGPSWYKHINGTRGRGAANGSVYLITGVDKTQVWGTGVYSQVPMDTVASRLTFEKTAILNSNYEYVWARTHFASTKYGPSKEFFDSSTELPRNQCTFLRGFRVAINESIWRSLIMGTVEVSKIQDTSAEALLQTDRASNRFGSAFSTISANLGFSLGRYNTTSTCRNLENWAGAVDEPATIISDIPAPSMMLHPSDMINLYLLNKYNQAEVAITHDDVWCSAVEENAVVLPEFSSLLARIEERYETKYSNGGVSLQPKIDSSTLSPLSMPHPQASQLRSEQMAPAGRVSNLAGSETLSDPSTTGSPSEKQPTCTTNESTSPSCLSLHSTCEESSDSESTARSSIYTEIGSSQISSSTLYTDVSRVQQGSSLAYLSPQLLGFPDVTVSSEYQNLFSEEPETKLLAIFENLDWYRLTSDKFKSGSPAANKQAVRLLELLQKVMDHPNFTNHVSRQKLIVAMERLLRVCEDYLAPYDLGTITCNEKNFIARGGLGEVYRTKLHGQLVAVKMINPTGADADGLRKLRENLAREGVIWRQLSHPNVLPFYGLSSSTNWPFLVSPWMDNGDVNGFLLQNPLFNRCLLVTDITRGLLYLHSLHIVHGDLKGFNVLVDGSNKARLIDFGISSVVDSSIPHWTSQWTPASRGGTGHWQAPELLVGREGEDRAPNTKASDIWAWACVCYEIYTGEIPFHEINQHVFMHKAIHGALTTPSRPPESSDVWKSWGLSPEFWALMERCWMKNPDERPTIETLSSIMEDRAKHDPRPPSPVLQGTASKSWFGSGTKTRKPLADYYVKICKLLREEGLIDRMEAETELFKQKQVDESL